MAGRGGRDGWWSPEDEQRLIEMSEAGYSRYEAADEFGCNVDRISVKAQKLGIKLRPKLYWKDSEIALLRSMAEANKTVDEIADALNKSTGAVYGYARKYGIIIKTVSEMNRAPENFGTRWTEADENALAELVSDNVSIEQIAKESGRTPASVRSRMARLHLRYRK